MDYSYLTSEHLREAEPTNEPTQDFADQTAPQAANETFHEPVEPLMKRDDLYLPRANVAAIMKRAVPANALIATDAKELVGECVSEFIQFITSEASENCSNERRKTITGNDILTAMSDLGMENYALALRPYLKRYLEVKAARAGKGQSHATGHSSKASDPEVLLQGQLEEPKEIAK